MVPQFYRCALWLFVVMLPAGNVMAQRNVLSAELDLIANKARSGAPMFVDWRLNSSSAGLLEGRLELTVYSEDKRLV